MEASFSHRGNSPDYMPGAVDRAPAEAAEIIQLHPSQSEEGFFEPQLEPQQQLPFYIQITDWEPLKSKQIKGIGHAETSVVKLADGARYIFQKIIPDGEYSPISTDITLPLGTRVKGFNEYMGRKLAKSGIHSRVIGTNQKRGYSLLHDAQASLHILAEDDRQAATCETNESVILGYSMGCMKALGMLGLAPHFGRSVQATIGLDPCLANKVDYQKQLKEFPELISYLGRELLELPIGIGRNLAEEPSPHTIFRALHFVNSIGITPQYLRNTKDKWDVLATGEAGTFPASVPKEAVVILHFFKECRFNDLETYKELFAGHPNVKIIEEDGLHVSGANSSVIRRSVSKARKAMDMIEQGVAPSDMANALREPILRR